MYLAENTSIVPQFIEEPGGGLDVGESLESILLFDESVAAVLVGVEARVDDGATTAAGGGAGECHVELCC